MPKRILLSSVILFLVLIIANRVCLAEKQSASYVVNQLETELQNTVELRGVRGQLKNMAEKGMTKDELKKVLGDLAEEGVKGKDFENSINSMNDLVNSGEEPKKESEVRVKEHLKVKGEGKNK